MQLCINWHRKAGMQKQKAIECICTENYQMFIVVEYQWRIFTTYFFIFCCLPGFSKFLTKLVGDLYKKEMRKTETKVTDLLLSWAFIARPVGPQW